MITHDRLITAPEVARSPHRRSAEQNHANQLFDWFTHALSSPNTYVPITALPVLRESRDGIMPFAADPVCSAMMASPCDLGRWRYLKGLRPGEKPTIPRFGSKLTLRRADNGFQWRRWRRMQTPQCAYKHVRRRQLAPKKQPSGCAAT